MGEVSVIPLKMQTPHSKSSSESVRDLWKEDFGTNKVAWIVFFRGKENEVWIPVVKCHGMPLITSSQIRDDNFMHLFKPSTMAVPLFSIVLSCLFRLLRQDSIFASLSIKSIKEARKIVACCASLIMVCRYSNNFFQDILLLFVNVSF